MEEVWQVYPDERIVLVRRRGVTVDFTADQMLTSAVLLGFESLVESFFVG